MTANTNLSDEVFDLLLNLLSLSGHIGRSLLGLNKLDRGIGDEVMCVI